MVADLIDKKGLSFKLDIRLRICSRSGSTPCASARSCSTCWSTRCVSPAMAASRSRVRVDEKEAIISVSDSGVGIKAEDLPQIFDEFYQVGGVDALGRTRLRPGVDAQPRIDPVARRHDERQQRRARARAAAFSFSLPTTRQLVARMPTTSQLPQAAAAEKRRSGRRPR